MNVFLCPGASVRYISVPVFRALMAPLGVNMTDQQMWDAILYDHWPSMPPDQGGCTCSYCREHPASSYAKWVPR